MRAIGIISGTSMDGIDVALVETDGEAAVTRGAGMTMPYTPETRRLLVAALAAAKTVSARTDRPAALAEAERAVTAEHGAALERFIAEHGEPDVVGFHGQTVFHAPARGITVQLGDGQAVADRLGVPVVSDMRAADVAAGGQGAPLVPAYHRALVRQAGVAEPALVINLGGVANVTFVDGDTLIAFDTGPASAMVDDVMATVGRAWDDGGAVAASGRVDAAALAALLDYPFFREPAPKSLDRDAFSAAPVAGLALEHRVATLTRFSAEALGRAVALLPRTPVTALASGGGTHNATLMRWIAEALGVPVASADTVGFSSDHMEAEAFAYLAVRSLSGLPLSFPGTTGIPAPQTGGILARPRRAVSSR